MKRVAIIALPVYWIALFVATHVPSVRIPGQIPQSDKLVHFAAFGLLALLWWWFAHARRTIGPRFVWVSAAVLIPCAAIDEYLQQFVGRHTDLADFIADAAGIASVLLVLEIRRRQRSAASVAISAGSAS